MLNSAVTQSEESSVASESLPGAPQSPINVWLVDDNRCLRSTLMEILDQCEGFQCTASFHSPNAVLSALASKAGPDVILLDIQMGNACGLDAIRPIKTLSRSTQVLMLTTFFDSESERRALTAGASGFLLKRFPLEQILDSIQQASRNPAPHLKCSREKSRTSSSALESNSSCPDEKALRERKPANGTQRRPQKRLLWLRHCLDLIPHRGN